MTIRNRYRRGSTSLLAVFFVTLFSVLALSFVGMSNVNVQMANNHEHMVSAMMAAESGLEYADTLIASYMELYEASSFDAGVSDSEALAEFTAMAGHVQVTAAGTIPAAAAFDEGGGNTGTVLNVPAISVKSGDTATFSLQFKQYDDTPQEFEVTSTGTSGGLSRTVLLRYNIVKDTTLLQYAVASRSRIIITGDSTIEGDIMSTWGSSPEETPETWADIAPPFELAADSTVNGTMSTVLTEQVWGDSDNSHTDVILGTHDGLLFEQPEIPGYETSDFDTTVYANMTTDLPTAGSTQYERFPHGPDGYTDWTSGAKWFARDVYAGETLSNVRVPAGSDALFQNCTFEGVLYIEGSMSSGQQNNIRFENCNFNGIIVTAVPDTFDWKDNVLYFTGGAIFNNTFSDAATILAPNFNVNIGNTQSLETSPSTIKGLVVGGIVDVRGNANFEGTILSMYDPSPLGYSAAAYGTNAGYSDENNEAGSVEYDGTILISPDPDNLLPLGVSARIVLSRDADSFVELY